MQIRSQRLLVLQNLLDFLFSRAVTIAVFQAFFAARDIEFKRPMAA
jgi:hypothetical protein